MPNGRYDEEPGHVVFTTTHFSGYAVGYRKVSFRDVSADAWYGRPPQTGSGRGPEDFSDAGQAAPWAAEAMTRLTERGLISGSGGALKPADTTTRAEMAQVLCNLMER